jgi:hypothetical protein
MKSKGFLLHAFNNRQLDYGKLAVCCALSIKTHLQNNNTTLLTDFETSKHIKSNFDKKVIKSAFNEIIISKEKYSAGKRRHHDSPWVTFRAKFDNKSRVRSYDYTPYDETILIDTDYLVMDNSFDEVWGNNQDFLMNHKCVDLKGDRFGTLLEQRLSRYGIPMYWATLVYFKKCEFSEIFFNLVDYIREEYNFFQFLYEFPLGFYRNDYSFSIAAHILNGYITDKITSFPQDTIIASYQKDGIAEVKSNNEIIFLSHDTKEEWRDTLVNIKGMNVHIMNKKELMRVSEKYINFCMEKL